MARDTPDTPDVAEDPPGTVEDSPDVAKDPPDIAKDPPDISKDTPDARPAADPSEVDAKPISSSSPGPATAPVPVPTSRDSASYDLSGLKRVIIFNQRTFASRLKLNPRNGTEVDVRAIEATFGGLGWQVATYTDSTVAQIRDVILKQVQLCEEEVAALAIFLLSHGEDNGTVFAQDYPFRVDHDVLGQLTADKCPGLVGRPKLVFVQACQGQATDQGAMVTDRRRRHTSQDTTSAYKIPNYADFLIFQASFWDHYSFRSSETGSWFIQALCDKIDDSPSSASLQDVLLTVSASVALNKESNVPGRPNLDKKKQVPLLYSTMLRRMYLKEPALSSTCSVDCSRDSPALPTTFADLRVEGGREGREGRGSQSSQRSQARKEARDKDKDKDCQIM